MSKWYDAQLRNPRWKQKRISILKRDGFKSVHCSERIRKAEHREIQEDFGGDYNAWKDYTDHAKYESEDSCDEDPEELHVHHKAHQSGRKAWEYPDDNLITLCWICHLKERNRIRHVKLLELYRQYHIPRMPEGIHSMAEISRWCENSSRLDGFKQFREECAKFRYPNDKI